MATKQTSTEFTNLIRGVNTIYNKMVAESQTIQPLIPEGAPATSLKTEWVNNELAPTTYTIASFGTDGDGTVFNFSSTAGLAVGQVVRFTTSAGKIQAGAGEIAVVNSGTQITITRDYGEAGTSLATLNVGDIMKVQYPKPEQQTFSSIDNRELSIDYNYLQIFERTVEISETLQKIRIYGQNDTYNEILAGFVADALQELIWEQEEATLMGIKAPRVKGGDNGTMGGFHEYMSAGNAVAVNGAISYDAINDGFQKIHEDGGMSSRYALIMSVDQARKISALNVSGTNPIMQITQATKQIGSNVNRFVSDFEMVQGRPYGAQLIVSYVVPKDILMIVDMTKVAYRTLRPLTIKNSTQSDEDSQKRTIILEKTLQFQNKTKAHCILTGLT